MTDVNTRTAPRDVVYRTIGELLSRRGAGELAIESASKLTPDLGLDSLELAELSAALEDEFGSDPYSDGIVPETVGALIAYYDA